MTRFYEAFDDLVSPDVKRVSILAKSSRLLRARLLPRAVNLRAAEVSVQPVQDFPNNSRSYFRNENGMAYRKNHVPSIL